MTLDESTQSKPALEVSVVVPVYQGERTLALLAEEVSPLTLEQSTTHGRSFRVVELVLVHDGAVDGSARVMKELAEALRVRSPDLAFA